MSDIRPIGFIEMLMRDDEFVESADEAMREICEKTQRHGGKAKLVIELTVEVAQAGSGKASVLTAIKKIEAPHSPGSGEKMPYHAQVHDEKISSGDTVRAGFHKNNPYQPVLFEVGKAGN